MFKSWSIKNLLNLWAAFTVVAIVLMTVAVMYFNELFLGMAHELKQSRQWVLIIVVIALAVGLLLIISTISKQINTPLAKLNKAMEALSRQKFETRLNMVSEDNEFSLIAKSFNQFADTTQNLIGDLAKAKDSLQEQEQHLRTVLNSVPEAILSLSATGEIESINPFTEKLLGADQSLLLGEHLTRFFDQEQQMTCIEDILDQQDTNKEFKGLDYNGEPFSMWLSLNSVSSQGNNSLVCVISDITAWKETEQQLTTTSSELDTIIENAMVGIAFIKDRLLLRVNHKFEEIFGYSKDEVSGRSTRYLCPNTESFEQLGVQAYNQLEQGETFEGVMQLSKKSGEIFWCSLSSKAISNTRPQDGTIWLFEDVTKQRENDEKLRALASLDSLTGLPNRGVFNDRLAHAIHKAHRTGGRLAVFFLDLDHFKQINDSLGHKAGDELLCEVANRLKSCVREGDTIARLGGDEFTVILEDVGSVQFVAKVAEKVLDSVLHSYSLGSVQVNISSSIGVSLYPADGRDADVLIRNADAAMYHAKNTGRNNFQFYSAEMNAQAAHRLEMETDLRRAVEQSDFYLHFQPQVDINTETLLGAEVLLRWNSEKWGDVSPVEFIPILEDTGLIGVVGEMVLKEACVVYMSLRDRLNPDFKMAVNLSGRQFQGSSPLAVYVKKVLDDTGMSSNNLELEITESILMKDTELAITTLSQLTALGVTLAIDDFGTGYSSLSYLKKFPLNVLKIDKSFINDVTKDADDAAIVDAILAMSKHLQLDVVAEGIETAEQLTFLKQHNCHRGQGYYFSRPLDFDGFNDLVAEYQLQA